MKERIILAPGINGSELIRNLALSGKNSMNLKVMSAVELARFALMRSGIPIKEEFLSSKEECALVARAVSGVDYFAKTTYSDIRQLSQALKNMRSLSVEEDKVLSEVLPKGIFTEKNEALLKVYHNYMELLNQERLLDGVALIRKAITESKAIDAEFLTFKECILSPIERTMLDQISGGKIQELSIRDLYDAKDKPLHIEDIKNCYGAANEIETILQAIYKEGNADQCTIALGSTDPYVQLLFDYAILYNLPITFGCGIPVMNSNPAKLLVLYYHWITNGFFDGFSLNQMLSSEAFHKGAFLEQMQDRPENFPWKLFYEILGGLRLTNNLTVNIERIKGLKQSITEEEKLIDQDDTKAFELLQKKRICIPYIERMSKELALTPEEFIYRYSYIRKGSGNNAERLLMWLDMSAASAIYEELAVIRKAGTEQSSEDIIAEVLKLGIGGQSSKEGAFHVTDIKGAGSTLRKNLYVAGLSSSMFPGSPTENYLLLDEDLKLFGNQADYMTSIGRIAQKKESLQILVHLASDFGCRLHLSYAGMNVSELKKDNASSVIYELFRDVKGRDVTSKELEENITKVSYFDPAVSVTREVGKAYNQGKHIVRVSDHKEKIIEPVCCNLECEYSPSALNMFFDCPRRFMLKYILGIAEPDEAAPFEIMSAAAKGTLAHELMEQLANAVMTVEEFAALSEEYFDRYIAQNPPVIKESVEPVRHTFLEMMETAYEMDPHREVILKEEDIHCTHESGVKIHGYPDRVEKLADDNCYIADFKSGRQIKHVEDDIDTCLQVVIYAYLMEQLGYSVSGGEFRYISLGESVSCRYDADMKEKLNEKLTLFRHCMENGEFDCAADEEACKYCSYGIICERNQEGGEEE